ncbi:MAG: chloride channel protein [Opitutales bacterium]
MSPETAQTDSGQDPKTAARQAGPQPWGKALTHFPDWMRGRFSDNQRFMILCVVAGLVCGLIGVLFHLTIQLIYHDLLKLGFRPAPDNPIWLLFLLAPAGGGLIVGLIVTFLAPAAAGSGIPQTKEAYHNKFGVIRGRDAFWRFVAGSISVGCGNSLGREGPTCHICAAVASKLARLFGLAKVRVQAMIPVGMGAGIAAAFNTPLAAIFFVFEKLLGTFSSKALGGMVMAVVVAAVVERSLLGGKAALQVEPVAFATEPWMLLCLPLGLVAAVVGHLFVEAILTVRGRFKTSPLPPWLRPAVGGLGVGVIGCSVLWVTNGHDGVFSVGYADLNHALSGNLTWHILLVLLLGKLMATTLCFGAGGSGGVFAPTLFIGSMLGGLVGTSGIGTLWVDPQILEASALLGMGAFFAAVIRCPLTSVLLIVELTRNYSLILPLMAGNALAYFLASRWRSVPIYDALLLQDNISLKQMPNYQGEQDWRNLPVSTIMTYEPVTLNGRNTARSALGNLKERCHHAYPVLDKEDQRLIGMVTHHELQEARDQCDERPLEEWGLRENLITVCPGDSIRDVARTLVVTDVLQAPVVSRTDPGRLIGVVTLHDIARQQNAIADSFDRTGGAS